MFDQGDAEAVSKISGIDLEKLCPIFASVITNIVRSKKRNWNDVVLFIATDIRNREDFGAMLIKYLPGPPSVYLKTDLVPFHPLKSKIASSSSLIDTVVEWALLRECDVVFSTDSGFSRSACSASAKCELVDPDIFNYSNRTE